MKNLLILVKHSVPESVEGLPAHKWSLSEEGRGRAVRLARQLIRFQPQVIVSSREPKPRRQRKSLQKFISI